MTLLDGLFTGLVIGTLFALPIMIREALHPETRMPFLMDVETFWGKKLSEGMVIFSSAIVHLGMSTLYGGFVPLLVRAGLIAPVFPLWNLLGYSIAFNLSMGLVALPAVGFGFFGHKEGPFVWFELLVTHLMYAFAFWGLAHAFFR